MEQVNSVVAKFGSCKSAGVYFIIAMLIALVVLIYGIYMGTGYAVIGFLINCFWIAVITALTYIIANYAPTRFACELSWVFVALVVLLGFAMNLGFILVPAKYLPTSY